MITKSGGLSNEIIWICSQFADGITTAIGIGGDAYPGTDYVAYLEKFEQDPQTKAVIIVGEMGGDLEERAAEWYGAKKRRIKLLGVVSGFCQESLPKGMKFGHAGRQGRHEGRRIGAVEIRCLQEGGRDCAGYIRGAWPGDQARHTKILSRTDRLYRSRT